MYTPATPLGVLIEDYVALSVPAFARWGNESFDPDACDGVAWMRALPLATVGAFVDHLADECASGRRPKPWATCILIVLRERLYPEARDRLRAVIPSVARRTFGL